MIDLERLGYKDVQAIYLFDFVPGCGGDFFITLASKCSPQHVGSWNNTSHMQKRISDFEQSLLMPGNNIGGKLIYADTVDEYKQNIQEDLIRIKHKYGTQGKYMSFCTHPTGNNVNTRISNVLAHCFPGIPIQRVALTAQTTTSIDYTYFWYAKEYKYDKELITHWQSQNSRFIYWEDTANTLVIDHMDLFINNPALFKQAVLNIGSDVNMEWYDYITDLYTQTKVKPFMEQHGA
jgi:hypothetical protein